PVQRGIVVQVGVHGEAVGDLGGALADGACPRTLAPGAAGNAVGVAVAAPRRQALGADDAAQAGAAARRAGVRVARAVSVLEATPVVGGVAGAAGAHELCRRVGIVAGALAVEHGVRVRAVVGHAGAIDALGRTDVLEHVAPGPRRLDRAVVVGVAAH